MLLMMAFFLVGYAINIAVYTLKAELSVQDILIACIFFRRRFRIV